MQYFFLKIIVIYILSIGFHNMTFDPGLPYNLASHLRQQTVAS